MTLLIASIRFTRSGRKRRILTVNQVRDSATLSALGAGAAGGRRAVIALEGVAVAPGVGVDIDLVAVLGEAIDEGDDAGGAREDAPTA